jgi:hypothetical protein
MSTHLSSLCNKQHALLKYTKISLFLFILEIKQKGEFHFYHYIQNVHSMQVLTKAVQDT